MKSIFECKLQIKNSPKIRGWVTFLKTPINLFSDELNRRIDKYLICLSFSQLGRKWLYIYIVLFVLKKNYLLLLFIFLLFIYFFQSKKIQISYCGMLKYASKTKQSLKTWDVMRHYAIWRDRNMYENCNNTVKFYMTHKPSSHSHIHQTHQSHPKHHRHQHTRREQI